MLVLADVVVLGLLTVVAVTADVVVERVVEEVEDGMGTMTDAGCPGVSLPSHLRLPL